jgi:hypothetical protein
MICEDIPRAYLLRVWRGYRADRSGDIQFIPDFPHYVGTFAAHSGPWPYLQEVPMLFFGPGHVSSVGTVTRHATMADVAPTLAKHLRFDFAAPDGSPLREAVEPGADPPKLILTLVWDGGGRDVLDAYPDAWPNLRSLMSRGAWYENFTVGSSPSVTPSIHSSLGTGAFPRHHGIVDLRFRFQGGLDPSAFQRATRLLLPALGDEYDQSEGNAALVGMVGAEGTLGMIGRGAEYPGGDQDLAAGQRAGVWGLSGYNKQIYDFPEYVREVPGLESSIRQVDLSDGRADGLWYGDLDLSDADARTLTPGYARYQTRVVAEIIRREGFGADDTPDLLYVNYKQIDKVGHKYSFPSPQMEAAVASSDDALGDLIRILNREVGEGEWVLALTADHGSTPKPETTGATIIGNFELEKEIRAAFDGDGDGRDVLGSMRVTQFWLNTPELEQNGYTVEDVARFVANYTGELNAQNPTALTEAQRRERLMAAAFPGYVLENPPCLPGG